MKIRNTIPVRGSKGYTIVELIVVFAIIGIMTSAILIKVVAPGSRIEASPAAIGSTTAPEENSAEQTVPEGLLPEAGIIADKFEFRIVQTALDTMMLREKLTGVAETGYTGDMSAFPRDNPLYPGYFRNRNTRCLYSCDSTGQISQTR
ncbi:MAG: type II secretion system protein [Dehalococcoidales bacterium]|nr:type II secretion system protein [Dehalococcoidales bacterium]